jgi:hypothetical protein
MKWYHKSIFEWIWLYIIPIILTLVTLCGVKAEGAINIPFGIIVFTYFIWLVIMIIWAFISQQYYLSKEREEEKVYRERSNLKHNILNTCDEIIDKHKDVLVTQRSQLIYTDAYGDIVEKDWIEKGIKYFINTKLKPKFWELDRWQIDLLQDQLIKKINLAVELEVKKKKKIEIPYDVGMNGVDYEIFCKNLLEKNGWKVKLTKKTGDQGVDLIANKDGIIIAFQCKKHNRPVGNKAVQEIFTGKQFYDIEIGGVISNSPFTDSARKLATKNKILLLHHNDLQKIENHISKRK